MPDIYDSLAGLSPQQRRLLELWLRQDQPERPVPAPGIPQAPAADAYPLSFAQQRLWFLAQLQPDATGYTIAASVRVQGQLAVVALVRSLRAIVRRHAVLRTTFADVDGQALQMVVPAERVRLPLLDLRALSADVRAGLVQRIATEDA